jgi:hypothetical protein
MNAAPGRKIGAVLAALGLCLAAAPSRAGEDGQASLITGMAETFGLIKHDSPQIDYRERSRLVLPPKMTLPPPGRSAGSLDPSWPTDNETIQARKQKKIEDAEPSARQLADRDYVLVRPGDEVKVTTSGFNRHGPSCRVPDPKTGECPEAPHKSLDWNPLSWVGLEKKPKTTLGPEPERQNLVDPPPGYRAPAEGVGAKVED